MMRRPRAQDTGLSAAANTEEYKHGAARNSCLAQPLQHRRGQLKLWLAAGRRTASGPSSLQSRQVLLEGASGGAAGAAAAAPGGAAAAVAAGAASQGAAAWLHFRRTCIATPPPSDSFAAL